METVEQAGQAPAGSAPGRIRAAGPDAGRERQTTAAVAPERRADTDHRVSAAPQAGPEQRAAAERPAGPGGFGGISRKLWIEEPAVRYRLPDPVRTAAVRAWIIGAVTLIQAVVAFLCTVTASWLAFPAVISAVVFTVVATWAVLDVWVTRQVWKQRHGVVSLPSSTARRLRKERRRARRTARHQRARENRIRRRNQNRLSRA